jgi:hypothetical protein
VQHLDPEQRRHDGVRMVRSDRLRNRASRASGPLGHPDLDYRPGGGEIAIGRFHRVSDRAAERRPEIQLGWNELGHDARCGHVPLHRTVAEHDELMSAVLERHRCSRERLEVAPGPRSRNDEDPAHQRTIVGYGKGGEVAPRPPETDLARLAITTAHSGWCR